MNGENISQLVLVLLVAGIGGSMTHLRWMIDQGRKGGGQQGLLSRFLLLLASFIYGAVMGLPVYFHWYSQLQSASDATLHSVLAYAFAAGFTGDIAYSLKRKLLQ